MGRVLRRGFQGVCVEFMPHDKAEAAGALHLVGVSSLNRALVPAGYVGVREVALVN
jgi:hypothetical protein